MPKTYHKVILILFLGFITSGVLQAQNFSNTYQIFDQHLGERGHSIQEFDNRWFVSGANRCNNYMNDCSYMTEFDQDGEIIMNRLFNWKDTGIGDEFFIKNDTIVFSGHTNGYIDPSGYATTLTRLTLDGDSIDSYTYPILRDSISNTNNFGVIEYENHYYLHGDVGQIGGPPLGIIQKVKKTGEFVAEYFFEDPDGDGDNLGASHVFDLQAHPGLGLVFLNYLDYPIDPWGPDEARQIVQFDTDNGSFNLIHETANVSGDQIHHSIKVTTQGEFVFLREWETSSYTFSLVWVNSFGEVLKTFEMQYEDIIISDSGNGAFYSLGGLSKTEDDGFIICGSIGYFTAGNVNYRGLLIKISPDGEFEWQRMITYTPEYNVFRDAVISAAQELSDGSILATGFVTIPYQEDNIERDYWLLHLDENGCLYEGDECTTEQLTTSTIEISEDGKHQQSPFLIYPNPAEDILYIDSQEDLADYHYSIYNAQGKLMKKGKLSGEISISEFSAGSYICSLYLREVRYGLRKLWYCNKH